MRYKITISLFATFWVWAAAGVGPENVAVVVNADSWASKAVANEFIHLRQVPACNVVYLGDLPNFEQVDIETFRTKILRPVLTTLARRGLSDQIDCVAYSSDLPWRINVASDMKARAFPKYITAAASINGLTFLHNYVLAKDPNYLDLDINRYARRPLPALNAQRIPRELRRRYAEAANLLQDKKWAEALPILSELAEETPKSPDLQYNLACCLARGGQLDSAMAALQRAVNAGFLDAVQMKRDPDLKPLRARVDFKDLTTSLEAGDFAITPTHGFRSTYKWDAKGNPTPSVGPSYLLSTMLAVTSGRGNSVREALECLRRSVSADGTRPAGTIYYMKNANIRSVVRQWGFAGAVRRLNDLGVAAEVTEGVLPNGKSDVAGLMAGSATFDWPKSKSAVLPGAICEHLTSAGGVMREGAGQTPLSEFIRAGAAGASGTVAEPYALQQKFPNPFLHVHYARGCTLAEAFYQSITGPYQLLIVGDPLCRPWATLSTVTAEGAEPNATVKGRLTLQPGAAREVAHYEFFVDGRRMATCRPGGALDLDTTRLCDGYHEFRIVAVFAGPMETQGRMILPLSVDNHGRKLFVSRPGRTALPLGAKLSLSAKLPGATEIAFMHNHRRIAVIQGPEGSAAIDTRLLGIGNARVQPVGILAGGDGRTLVTGVPIELEVTPPPALPARIVDAAATFAKGMVLTPAGGEPLVIASTRARNWLKKAGVKDGQTFTLEGLFSVETEDAYQFQVRFPGAIAIEVDGEVLAEISDGRWHFLPVTLAVGTHTLRAVGTPRGPPRLGLRFGGRGCRSVGADRFRHAVRPAAN